MQKNEQYAYKNIPILIQLCLLLGQFHGMCFNFSGIVTAPVFVL